MMAGTELDIRAGTRAGNGACRLCIFEQGEHPHGNTSVHVRHWRKTRSKTRVIGTTTDAIQEEEKKLGRTLPKSFSDWLLSNNGKSLGSLTIFLVLDARDPRKTWESLDHHFKKDWQEWLENFSDTSTDFSGLLPFAEFGTGDYYCFNYAVKGQTGEPVVVLWCHETGEIDLVAESFTLWMLKD